MNEKRLYKEYVEEVGHCERCGSKQNLQLHHIKTRKIKKLRTDKMNWLVVCFNCHSTFFHKEPLKAKEWLWKYHKDKMEYIDLKLKEPVK